MFIISSSDAQNTFAVVIEKSQREIVSVTRRGRPVMLAMSPEVLQDYVDIQLALEAETQGMLSAEATKLSLDRYR